MYGSYASLPVAKVPVRTSFKCLGSTWGWGTVCTWSPLALMVMQLVTMPMAVAGAASHT